MTTEEGPSPEPKPRSWGLIAVVLGVLAGISGYVVYLGLGTPEGEQISRNWLVIPGVFLLAFVWVLWKVATRRF